MGNSEPTWWPAAAGFEIALDGAGPRCRDRHRNPLADLPPEVVNTRRYPAWALVNRPSEADEAMAAATEATAGGRMKTSDMALALERIGRRLPASHLPAYLEEAARSLAARGDTKRAGTLFARAREVEAEQQLPIADGAWLAVHREFAALGALSAKAVPGFVKDLKTRAKPDDALDTLISVAVFRTHAGQAPWPQLPKQLSAFAKTAGRDEIEVHRTLLEQMCGAEQALQESAAALWTAWRPILVQAAKASARVRGLLLNLLPYPESLDGWWLELLEECGATAGLLGAADPGAEPAGGRAQWLARVVRHPKTSAVIRSRGRVRTPLPTQLSELIVRMAPALRADGVPVRLDGPNREGLVDVRVLETCLAHGVPVADLLPDGKLDFDLWWHSWRPGDDLAAVVADPRFAPAARTWAERGDAVRLWAVPALRQYLTPPAGGESATHPLDGPRIEGAIYSFGHVVGSGSPMPAKHPLYSIRILSRALRTGTPVAATDVHGLGYLRSLAGRVEWVVLRALSPSTTEDRRELLTAFLEVWAESVFAEPDVQTLLAAADLDAAFPGAVEHGTGWGTADRLRQLVDLIREHGPVPHDPQAAAALAERTGLSRPAAELALAGLLGVQTHTIPLMTAEERNALGLNTEQLEEGRSRLSLIVDDQRLELLVGVLPQDVAALWRPGGMAAVAERLAENWRDSD